MKIFANMLRKKSSILPWPVVKSRLARNIWIESGRKILGTGSK
jgi:hypothetical protein